MLRSENPQKRGFAAIADFMGNVKAGTADACKEHMDAHFIHSYNAIHKEGVNDETLLTIAYRSRRRTRTFRLQQATQYASSRTLGTVFANTADTKYAAVHTYDTTRTERY